MTIRIEPRDGLYHITFPYDPSTVAAVKQIPGRKWDKETREWTVPMCLTTRSFIKHVLPGTIFPDVVPPQQCEESLYKPNIKGYEHQERISRTLIQSAVDGRGLPIFAETGTGKTKAVIDALDSLPNTRTLVVCPRPLIGVWQTELNKWGSRRPIIVHGSKRPDPRSLHDDNLLAITSYGTLVNDLDLWKETSLDIAVFDEAHLLKNKSSQRSKACRKIDAMTKVPMTGTPYGNEYKDLWAQIDVADETAFGPWPVFANAFCVYGGWEDKEIIGYQNQELMMQILHHTGIVVRKRDCLDLPEKQYQTIKVSMKGEQMKDYRRCEEGGVGDMPITSILTMIGKLRQISSGFVYGEDGQVMKTYESEKIEVLKEMCWDTPTVVWHNFTEEGDMIQAALQDAGVVCLRARGDGKAYEQSQLFENGKGMVIIAQMQTLQYGVTMNRATRNIYFSPTFSSLDQAQSEDRSHRIGQKNSVLYIHILASEVEQWIYDACRSKSDVRDYVLHQLKMLQNTP